METELQNEPSFLENIQKITIFKNSTAILMLVLCVTAFNGPISVKMEPIFIVHQYFNTITRRSFRRSVFSGIWY